MAVDYEALARQFGGTVASPTAPPTDYEALARQFGGQVSQADQIPGAQPQQAQAAAAAPSDLVGPTTTPLGLAGGLARGLTAPMAGVTAGAAIGAPFGPGGAALGGALGGTIATGVSLVPIINQKLQDLYTRIGLPVPQSGAEKFAQELGPAVVGGVAAPSAVGRAAQLLSRGTRAEATVAPIAEAVRVGGMGPTGGRTALERVGAGTLAGGIGTLPVSESGTDTAIGAVVGGVTPPVFRAGGAIVGGLYDATIKPLMQPAAVAARQMYQVAGGTPTAAQQTVEQIRRGMQVPMTPGFEPTLPELVVAGGGEAPLSMSVLAERVQGASPKVLQETQQQMNRRVGALQAQLSRVNQQIDQQGAMLQPGALEELTRTRDQILATLDNERGQMETALRGSAGRLPTTPQAVGEDIAARAEQLSEQFRATQVRPAYQAATQAAGDARINIDSVVAEAERVLGRPLSSFSPDTAPAIVRRIMAMRPAEPKAQPVGRGEVTKRMMRAPAGAPEPTTATLGDLDDLRKAINSDVVAASRGQGTLAGVEQRNLLGLQRTIDAAIDNSDTLPQQAKDLYGDALRTYREGYAPRFREGETGRLLKAGMFGEQRIEPAQVVAQFTKDRDAALQFVRTFNNDPQAYDALRQGILGQFQLAAVDPQTLMVDPKKAAAFLQKNAEAFGALDSNGLGIRNALTRFEQEATQASQVFERLKTQAAPFRDKPAATILTNILDNPALMAQALKLSGTDGKDTIRRVVQTRLNQMLTQTPGGEPLTEAGVMKVVKEVTTDTGELKPSYRLALGDQLTRDFVDRAKGLRLVIETGKDPMLKNPNAIAPAIQSLKATPDQLTDIKLVVEDLKRANQVAEAARQARKSAKPSGTRVLEEQAEGAPAQFDKMQLLSRTYTLFRNTFISARDRINPRISARLANMLYNNPDEAIKVIEDQIAKAQKAQRPARIGRAVPPALGATGAGISREAIDTEEQ